MQKRIVIFANPNGNNNYSLGFIETFVTGEEAEFQVISLEEQLPEYTSFPFPTRKKRLEEILANAASETARSLSDAIIKKGLSCAEPQLLTGRFPASIEAWLEKNKADLLVKQALPCDGEFGHASKGDLRLSRHVRLPLMLLNKDFSRNASIVVGVPPVFHDRSGLPRAISVIKNAVFWAKKLDSSLLLVHAWELFGESVLRSRTSKEELDSERAAARENAEKEVKLAMEKAEVPGDLDCHIHLHKGDPTRILLAELELQKPTLVVLGSVANEGVKGVLLGNTAETVARRSLCNTLIIK